MTKKSIPKKCPKCGGSKISISKYDGFAVGCDEEADVFCPACGVFGSVNATIVPRRGTFKEEQC